MGRRQRRGDSWGNREGNTRGGQEGMRGERRAQKDIKNIPAIMCSLWPQSEILIHPDTRTNSKSTFYFLNHKSYQEIMQTRQPALFFPML